MHRFDTYGRLMIPMLCGVLGTALYLFSPLSHQAFCTPLTVPVILAPEGAADVPGAD